MAAYRISYYLYRSNPVILREIKVPAECTVSDLLAAFCLAMGISPVPGKIRDEEEQMIPEKKSLSEVVGTGELFHPAAGRAEIYQEKKKQEIASLTFFYEILEEMDETIPAPDILEGTDFHLPQNVFHIGAVNEILNGLEEQDSYTITGFGSFYRGQQDYNKKKTHNLLYSHFLPDKVLMLRTEYAVPLPTVLENKTINELRYLTERHHVYAYGTRKTEYVAALNHKLSGIDPSYIFRVMDILEYQNFRELVLNGKTACKSVDDLYALYPVLCDYGRISFSKKQGILLDTALMQEYEEWYDQEKETEFYMAKRVASVMTGCKIYYGVFTQKVCRTILDTLYPGEIPDTVLDQFWEKPSVFTELKDVSFREKTDKSEKMAYDKNLFHSKEEALYLQVLSEEYTQRYIPDRKTFETVSQKGMESLLTSYRELLLFMRPYAYGETDRRELCMHAINCLRKGYPVSDASKKTVEHFRYVWSGKETIEHTLEGFLEGMAAKIPNILFYGYSPSEAAERQIPPIAGTELNRLIREAIEAEKRAKEEAAARKAAVAARKKAAAKNSRTTGRRGSRS